MRAPTANQRRLLWQAAHEPDRALDTRAALCLFALGAVGRQQYESWRVSTIQALDRMVKRGWVRRTQDGRWKITAEGLRQLPHSGSR